MINAVAHRDYFLDGTQIQVDMFRDRLEITSPGGFYRGDPFGKTYDLSGIISKRRNELITSVLVSCNAMEAAGTGFDKITEEYRDADAEHRPYISSATDHFTLVLPDLTKARKASEIADYLGISDSSYFRSKLLENLVSHGYLEKNKAGEELLFKTNPDSVNLQ